MFFDNKTYQQNIKNSLRVCLWDWEVVRMIKRNKGMFLATRPSMILDQLDMTKRMIIKINKNKIHIFLNDKS